MPYEWVTAPDGVVELRAWPHRSLPRKGFVWFIGLSAALSALPLSALIESQTLWVVLPFWGIALWALWTALERSYRDGAVSEDLHLSPDRAVLRHHAGGHSQEWVANPHWIRPTLHRDHRIGNYLTLRGGPREVELGAFLTPQERQQLYLDLNERLSARR